VLDLKHYIDRTMTISKLQMLWYELNRSNILIESLTKE